MVTKPYPTRIRRGPSEITRGCPPHPTSSEETHRSGSRHIFLCWFSPSLALAPRRSAPKRSAGSTDIPTSHTMWRTPDTSTAFTTTGAAIRVVAGICDAPGRGEPCRLDRAMRTQISLRFTPRRTWARSPRRPSRRQCRRWLTPNPLRTQRLNSSSACRSRDPSLPVPSKARFVIPAARRLSARKFRCAIPARARSAGKPGLPTASSA